MFMLLVISALALFHSLLDYEVTLVAYCLSIWLYSENIYILWTKCVRESFFYCSQLLTELLEDKQIAKLEGSWYIQNVSTFPNTFATVSPLICVFWLQLTWTNVVFSIIALVSCFCAEMRLSEKIPENTTKFLFYQKTHGARRRDGEELGGRLTTRGRGLGLVAPRGGETTPAASSSPPFAYIYPSTWNYRGFGIFPIYTSAAPPPSETAIQNQKLRSGTLPGQGFGGDLHHHHHWRLSINHPWLPHPCVSNSRCRRRGW
jgi:hypothetical protein